MKIYKIVDLPKRVVQPLCELLMLEMQTVTFSKNMYEKEMYAMFVIAFCNSGYSNVRFL